MSVSPIEDLQTIADRLGEVSGELIGDELGAEQAATLVNECAELATRAGQMVEKVLRTDDVSLEVLDGEPGD